jgi:hypothetical protein
MAQAAVLLIPADWETGAAVGVSKDIYDKYRDEIEAGMYFALMRAAPEDKIVAQAELASASHPVDVREWKETPNTNRPNDGLGNPAEYVLPIRLTYTYDDDLSIPAAEVAERIDIDRLREEGFLPISRDTYDKLFDRYIENEG